MGIFAAFINSGQICMAGSRTFVQEGIYDRFVEKAAEVSKTLKMGDPFAKDTYNGP